MEILRMLLESFFWNFRFFLKNFLSFWDFLNIFRALDLKNVFSYGKKIEKSTSKAFESFHLKNRFKQLQFRVRSNLAAKFRHQKCFFVCRPLHKWFTGLQQKLISFLVYFLAERALRWNRSLESLLRRVQHQERKSLISGKHFDW